MAEILVGALLVVVVALSVGLTIQATYTLYIMLYTWDEPEAYAKAKAPEEFLPPSKSFSVLLPARHEEEVIADTIQRVVDANYPLDLLEVVVICSVDDTGTIAAAEEKIRELQQARINNTRVITFSDTPINKPHGLNVALWQTVNEVVTIFDAEDDIHPDIFNIVNTVMLREGPEVVQCGTQLMDYDSRWYSTLNVLEYFFWFKSRLHYHARVGAITLGGNTVFFSRSMVEKVGGWDERNLTEDADIGIRISCLGVPIRVVYDDRYVTREETPPTLGHFIRQRTRWAQGFMQTLMKGDWKKLPTFETKLLAFYTLAFPNAQAVLGLYLPVAFWMMYAIKTPVIVSMILIMPFYLLIGHFVLSLVGLYEFASIHGLRVSWKTTLLMIVTYLPYQWMLSFAALRAARRQLLGMSNWEKTKHTGIHRSLGQVASEKVGSRSKSK